MRVRILAAGAALALASALAVPALAEEAYRAPGYAAPLPPVPPVPPAPPAPPAHPVTLAGRQGVIIENGRVIRYEDMTPEQRVKLDARMREMHEKMARLQVRLHEQNAAREAHMREVMARVELRVREATERAARIRAEWTPERIRAITERAQAQAEHAELSAERLREIAARAEAQARAGERAAEAAERALDSLSRDLDQTDWRDAEPAK